MILKWKLIINNWMNCYATKNKSDTVKTEALVNIITHLRENLNLNESKSFLEAHTVEEFILEKYPDFKFENGSEFSSSEDHLYLAASLLLYFVCVNSKDVNLKSAMCSQLHVEDQETILTFSKNLMDCTSITFQNVQAAITDACGTEMTAINSGLVTVAETPPVLRSLHGEVRRLQAALDAERFDRNFLQEELSRTNNKLERLGKEKEQYKVDIMNLKAKLSLCCGGDHTTKRSEPVEEHSMKLAQQLNHIEGCLFQTQESLDKAIYERDGLKMKIKELKHDCDKWLSLSQQESFRAAQLAEDLETERRHVQSLRELVTDLRQHNQKKGMDSSHMEYDDPDCSRQSLVHNNSACSEACSYVIEVQLSEERAKVEELKERIVILQKENEQLHFSIEEDNSNHEVLIKEKDRVIDNLETRFKEQTELLESLRKEYENATLSWEKHKINTEQVIREKEKQINKINEQFSSLQQGYVNLDTERSNLTNKIVLMDEELTKLNIKYKTENEKLIASIGLLETNYSEIINEKKTLQNLLEEEKAARDIQETEKYELNKTYQTLLINNTELLNEKMMLIQQLSEEKSHRQIVEEQIKALNNEKMLLLNEKDDLVKFLCIEKAARDEIEGTNNKLSLRLKDLSDQHVAEVKSKVIELEKAADNIKQLQTKCQGQEELVIQMQTSLAVGLNKLKKVIEKNELPEDCLEKLIVIENDNEISGDKKCDLLVDIANMLTLEIKQSHIVIQNERSVVKEKANYINNLEQQLKQQQILLSTLETDFKDVTTSYEKHKLICKNVIKQKDDYIKSINDHLCELQQEIVKLQTAKDEMTKKIEALVKDMTDSTTQYRNEKQKLIESLVEQETKFFDTMKEKDILNKRLEVETSDRAMLHDQLIQEQAAKDTVQAEKSRMENDYKNLIADHDKLLKEKNSLSQRLSEEIALKQIAVDQNIELSANKEKYIDHIKNIENNLTKEVAKIKIMSEDKECLTQQLSEEKTARELLMNVKENILIEKNLLEKQVSDMQIEKDEISKYLNEIVEKNNVLEEKCLKEKNINEVLNHENRQLNLDLTEERLSKDTILNQNQSLSTQIESLNYELLQNNTIQKALLSDKELLVVEKEGLVKSLREEKSAYDEIESEKNQLSSKINDLNAQFSAEIENKEIEFKKLVEDLNKMQLKYQAQKETNQQIANTLRIGTNKLIEVLIQEKITNEVLRKLLTIEKENISVNDKCDLLINIANNLISEVVMKKVIEKSLEDENIALMEMKKVLKEKELQLFELNTEIKQLYDVIKETKMELHQDKQFYTTALEDKNRELQIIQNENESFNNDLNDVKIQLEIKVHSLKEKLVDSENLTDKLKKTYECQIDNLNMMITKLSNYLKDKTSELEVARKEKDRLQRVIEDNNKVIKTLEENVRTEKQNQNKLINDFESERQVLKNMVTVTESVMEDQRVTLNKAIVEHKKSNELLQQEQTILKEEIEHERKVCKLKVLEKESALEFLTKELMELKNAKNDLEKENELEKEALINEINILKNEIIESNIGIENIKDENNKLNIGIQNFMDDIVSLQSINSELKIKLEILENEFRSKSSELTKCLDQVVEHEKDLDDNLKVKTTYIFELENKLHKVVEDMKNVEQEKTILIIQRDDYLSKVKEIQKELELEKLSNAEERNKELHVKKTLMEKVSELNEQNIAAEEAICKYKNNNLELIDKVDTLNRINTVLEQEIAKLKNIDIKSTEEINKLNEDYSNLTNQYDKLDNLFRDLEATVSNLKQENMKLSEQVTTLNKNNIEITAKMYQYFKENAEIVQELDKFKKDCIELQEKNTEMEKVIRETEKYKITNNELQQVVDKLNKDNNDLLSCVDKAKIELPELAEIIDNLKRENSELREELKDLKKDSMKLVDIIEENKAVIIQNEQTIREHEQYKRLSDEMISEKLTLVNKCDILQDYHSKAEKELEERQKEINSLQKEMQTLLDKVYLLEKDSKAKDGLISKMSKEKDAIINDLNKKLLEENILKEKLQKDVEDKDKITCQLKHNLDQMNNEREALNILKKENEELIKVVGQRETFAVRGQESTSGQKNSGHLSEKESHPHQVDNTSDITHLSTESLKTISDLEKIIHDKNRTITVLQSDITYLKTLMAESETKLLDATKDLEVSRENCHQLSSQLKKIVQHKNDELSDLKKQVSKMSVNENRATQIIKVSAKYQAIILKRIAEIKSSTVLKELTNYGNCNNSENELRRSLSAGSITMDDLENFLETTERHIKKCSEKHTILQKERDRLAEVNRINESEIINLQKFLTELSVSFQTFRSIKDLYAQKLSKVISVQRTVRREILSLDGHITDSCMSKLERGYAAVMQDLAECTMNLERWTERTIGRTISSEKIKQAYVNDSERTSLAPSSVKNAGLEVQLDELENSFHKLLEEVSRAQKGEGAKEAQAITVMEVRAEYEDKLNRMKAKMKQLYAEQIAVFKEKQREEVAVLERELVRAREKLAQSSQLYEEHIRGLTSELWTVGEKLLQQKDEAEWLRRRQLSGSLMSLQHVHSSGLVPKLEDCGRPSGAQSLRSLPPNTNSKREGRGLHMSDEEGEVFDNRFLKELAATPGAGAAPGAGTGLRLSELQWRNSLCPPHLKSSYPAETQFVQALDEDEIKAMGPGAAGASCGVRQQRKEVGITAYKKPGPPTPSKQAGRLSATDSELRESLRVEAEPQPSRKTSTPSRIRSLFRSNKNDTTEGTPRTKRLSNIFRKRI